MARLAAWILLPLAAAFTRPTRSVRHPAQPLHAVDPVVAAAAVAAVPTGYFFYTMQQEKDAADTSDVVAAPTPAPPPRAAPVFRRAAWSGSPYASIVRSAAVA